MPAEIDLHPRTDRGEEILDELEQRTKMEPELREDGTRRYYLTAEGVDVHAFDPMLDKIASDWRDHITNWRLNQAISGDDVHAVGSLADGCIGCIVIRPDGSRYVARAVPDPTAGQKPD